MFELQKIGAWQAGKITDGKHVLPPEVRALWPLELGEEASAVTTRSQGGQNSKM
jgi:hypothetical protein